MTHALVIGGTGMLRGASLELARSFQTVSVVARSESDLLKMHAENSRIFPLCLDYTQSGKLLDAINNSVALNGAITLVICWVHDTAPEAPFMVAELINTNKHACEFYHVLGSADGEPGSEAACESAKFNSLPFVSYRQVVLGFIIEGTYSRWLSNDEISSGTIHAVRSKAPHSIVGVVRPWNKRP
jgi:hypothetical protein